MKKIYTLLAAFLLIGALASNAQPYIKDTLLYESFNFQPFYTNLIDATTPPPGNTIDPLWYSYDQDGNTVEPTLGLSGGFQGLFPFAYADTIDVDLDGVNDNTVIAASSWFAPFATASNWLITPNIQLGPLDTLFWKSASRQTPRYLDGYKVKISTTNNDDLSFGTTLYTAAEMLTITGVNDSVFSGYTFSTGWVQGLDGTYTENHNDSARLRGVLQPHFVSLSAYAGLNVFIAFHHDSDDDFLISFDDVMIRGNHPAGITENKTDMGLNLFPNPASENVQVNYVLSAESDVTINVYDVTGKLVNTITKAEQLQGRHFASINTAELAKGFYTVCVKTNNGSSTAKLIVK